MLSYRLDFGSFINENLLRIPKPGSHKTFIGPNRTGCTFNSVLTVLIKYFSV